MTAPQVVVVGAGIAGLTAAYTLRRRGVSVVVLEAGRRVGGRMTSDHIDGYVIDRGAQFLSTSYPIVSDLIAAVGLRGAFRKTSPWAAIRRGGRFHRFRYDVPWSPVASGLLSLSEGWRLGWGSLPELGAALRRPVNDYSAWANEDDETSTPWYNRRFGDWMTEYLIEPLLEGFYFQSPDDTSRALPLAVSGFLARGAQTMTLLGGIGALPEALAREVDVHREEPVERIEPQAGHVAIRTAHRTLCASHVIVAAPAPKARELIAFPNEQESVLLATPYASTVNVALGLAPAWRPPHSIAGVYGLLIPRRERRRIAAIAVETAKSPDRARAGVLLNVMLAGAAGSDLRTAPDDAILHVVLSELEDYLPGLTAHVDFHRLYRWEDAEPLSPVGRARAVRRYRSTWSAERRVLLSGDYAGMPFTEGAAETGRWAAQTVMNVIDR